MHRLDEEMFWLITEIFIVSIVNLIICISIIRKILLKFQWFHQNVTSDIPGNPHVFDFSVISLMRTLPEPSNTNIVWTRVPLKEPILIRGRLPPACINSLSIYGAAGSTGLPNSIELNGNINKELNEFEVEITNTTEITKENSEKVVLDSRNWEYGFCAMRNYLVPPGTAIYTPEIIRKSDSKVLRTSQRIIAGPTHLQMRTLDVSSLLNLLIFHASLWLFNSLLDIRYDSSNILVSNAIISFSSILLSYLFRVFMFELGRKGLLKLTQKEKLNTFVHQSLEAGAEGSQPSKLHQYWLMRFDIPKGESLSIVGQIHTKNQKYWSVVIYDEYGLPLSQYQHHENTNKMFISSCDTKEEEYQYDIRLVNSKVKHLCNMNGVTEIDITEETRGIGYVLFRLVHPDEARLDEILKYSSPKSSLL